jgi:hypothetical protein
MNTWYLIATPDNRKKYKLRMLTSSIFSFKKVKPLTKQLKKQYPTKQILVLKRTCQILRKVR